MPLRIAVSTCSFLLIFSLLTNAQQFGGNPPSLKWSQISNDTARVIFPSGLDSQALQVFSIVQTLGKNTLPTIGNRVHKINIIFQNQTTISNGYVQLAPFRSEFELTAEQNSFDLGSLPWQQQLAIHEYRHVQQYNNYRVGLSKAFFYLFGEGGQELANSIAIPNWFWEGDAVYQETLVSRQGRGRLPYFFNGYRSIWLSDKNYSWMKLRNGSLRDFIPDHYPLGYMLVAYGREKYGDDFWKKVTRDAAAYKGLFYPLQKAIYKYADRSYMQFRDDAINFFQQQVKTNEANDSISLYAKHHQHFAADEEFPQFLDADHIVFVKSSFKKPHEFVIRNIKDQKEKRIRTRAVSLDNYFSYRKNKIVYAAYEPDLRWGWRDFSVIRLLDVRTGKEKKITTYSKYFSPDISEDGLHIIAVDNDVSGRTTLHILNSNTGKVEKIIPNPDQLFYTYPKFYNQHQIIAAVRNKRGEMALGIFDIDSGVADWLTDFSMNVIGFPSVQNDTIYFSASYNGYDQMFASAGHKLYHLSSAGAGVRTGNYQLQEDHGNYVWTSFSAVGYKIIIEKKEQIKVEPIEAEQLKMPLMLQNIHSLENKNADLLDSIHFSNHTIKPYPPSFQLFNFHSWRPYITDPDYTFALVSENVLNSLESQVFAGYNRNEQYKRLGISASYGSLFPWLDFGVDYTFGRNALFRDEKVFWDEAEGKFGFTLPFNLSKARWNTGLQLSSDIIYNQRYYKGKFKDTFSSKGFAYINPALSFVHQTQQGQQQIYPKLAQSILFTYNRAVTTLQGNQLLASGYFYFPGLTATHSLVLTAAYQQRDSLNAVRFSNSFPFSRGYSGENFYRMSRFGVNYHFPLAYPDWGFGNMIYFLRIRANLFFDYTNVPYSPNNGTGAQQQYRSFGTEIYFDSKWWNLLPISFGIRYSHLLDADYEGRAPNQWEFILPINLLNQ